MAGLFIRKLLKKLGLLEVARLVKRKFIPAENVFRPCSFHLLIAVNRSLHWCIEKQIAEGGDYLEFGIFQGFTFWYVQALAADMGIKDMRFFGFDSFLGLPPISDIDKGGEFREGDFYCPRKDVEAFLTQYGVDWKKTYLVPGWYENTLVPQTRKKFNLRRCSLCVIDCDLYKSSRLALEFIEPLICNHSIILFDDWGDFSGDPNKGEQRAFFEFLARNPHIYAEPFMEFAGHGKGFMLNFRNA